MTPPDVARRRHVLIADDDPPIRALLQALLLRENLDIDVARDGVEAIESLDDRDYHLLILDIMMPRLDGIGVIRHLEQRKDRLPPAIIVMTAASEQVTETIPLEHVDFIVSKPFNIRTLVDAVHSALDRHVEIASA